MRLQASFRLGRRKRLCWEKIWPPEPPGAAGRAQTDGEEVGRQHPHLCFPGAGSPSPRWTSWGGKDAKKCRNRLFFIIFLMERIPKAARRVVASLQKASRAQEAKAAGLQPRGSPEGLHGVFWDVMLQKDAIWCQRLLVPVRMDAFVAGLELLCAGGTEGSPAAGSQSRLICLFRGFLRTRWK